MPVFEWMLDIFEQIDLFFFNFRVGMMILFNKMDILRNTPEVIYRYCGLCNEVLDFREYLRGNPYIPLGLLIKYWGNDEILIICCDCIPMIKYLFDGVHIEDWNDEIRIIYVKKYYYYSNVYYSDRVQDIIVDKTKLENILEMIFD